MPIINCGGNTISVTVDQSIVENSTNPVSGGAVYTGLAGKMPNMTGVNADTYGDATHVAAITVDSGGAITSVSEVAITDIGGDTWYGYDVSITSATTGLSFTNTIDTSTTIIVAGEVTGQPGVYLSNLTTSGVTVNGASANGTLSIMANVNLGTVTAITS